MVGEIKGLKNHARTGGGERRREKAGEEKYKNRKDVKIVAGGLLLSLIAILIGVVYAILQDIILGASSGYNSFFSTFTTGNWVLFGGVGLLSILGITLFMIYFWKNGYYLILRIMGILEKEDK